MNKKYKRWQQHCKNSVFTSNTHIKENTFQINLEKQSTHDTHATGKSPDFTYAKTREKTSVDPIILPSGNNKVSCSVCVFMCACHPSNCYTICPTFTEFGIYVESLEATLAAPFL